MGSKIFHPLLSFSLRNFAGRATNAPVRHFHAPRLLGAPASLPAADGQRSTRSSLLCLVLSLLLWIVGVCDADAGWLNYWSLSDTNSMRASCSGPRGCTNVACVSNLDGLPLGQG